MECVIIEDDQKVINLIKILGREFSEISFTAVDEDPEIALDTILKNRPQLIFINIESKNINFFEFFFEISEFCKQKISFIGLSTSKENAFEAYNYNFFHFILKPLNELSIRKSLLKFLLEHSVKSNDTICLKSYKDYNYLNIENILYLKADNNTTDFYMADGKIISAYKTLKVFEELLPDNFYRIHKSYIININCISRIHFGKSMCIISNQHKIPFTKTFIENINTINKVLLDNAMFTLS
jgi:DNA-binding LytR/AlgR family response regulator